MSDDDEVHYTTLYEPIDPGPQLVELSDVPGVREARAEGFTVLADLVGEIELAGAWPARDVRVVDDTRWAPNPEWDEEEDDAYPAPFDGKIYLVRSPWPDIDLDTVLKLAFRWRRRNEDAFVIPESRRPTGFRVDHEAERAVDRQFFAQTPAWVRAYQRGRVNRLT